MKALDTASKLLKILRVSGFKVRHVFIFISAAFAGAAGDSLFLFSLYSFLDFVRVGSSTVFEIYQEYGFDISDRFTAFGIVIALLMLAFTLRISSLRISFLYLEKVKKAISDNFVRSFLQGPFCFTKKYNSSYLTKLLTTDVDLILFNGYQQLYVFCQNIFLVSIICFALGSQYLKPLVLSATVLILLYFILFRGLSGVIGRFSFKIKDLNVRRGVILNDLGRNQRETKILALEKLFYSDFIELTLNLARLNSLNSFLGSFPKILFETIGLFGFIGLAIFLTAQDIDQVYGLILAFGLSSFKLLPAFQAIYGSFVGLKIVSATVQNFYDEASSLYLRAKMDLISKESNFTSKFRSVVFQNVRANSVTDVLYSDFSANVEAGEFVKIVGPSGSGKSTLVDAILGFRSLSVGSVEVATDDGLPPVISYICQNPSFFSGSIAKNLLLDNLSEVERQRCFNLLEEIGLDFPIYSTDVKVLSGGQLQRLAIVRGLLKVSDIYIFDECLTGLDTESSVRVQGLLHRELVDRTVFWISHTADVIMVPNQIWNIDSSARRIWVHR